MELPKRYRPAGRLNRSQLFPMDMKMKITRQHHNDLDEFLSVSRGRFVDIKHQTGKIGYILLWLIGVPAPILFVIYLLRGCT